MPACVLCYPTLSSSEISKGNVWSFCHPDFNTKQRDGFVGQQEDTVSPLRVTHPKPNPSISRAGAPGFAVWESVVNTNTDKT